MISADIDMPCPQAYAARFEGLTEAYRKIGYEPEPSLAFARCFRDLFPTRRRFGANIMDRFKQMGEGHILSRSSMLARRGASDREI